MAIRRRARITPTDSWPELQPLLLYPDQEDYEVIRPVVLFGFTPLERSQETGVSARSIYRKAQRFEQYGLPGLLETDEQPDSKRLLPRVIRRAIAELKAEYPPLSAHELARICYARFGRRPSPHTIKRVLAEEPPPAQGRRRFPRYLEMADPVQRRLAIVRLHADGWTNSSIAAYLGTNRPRVYKTLRRWSAEEFKGLEDRPSSPHQPATKVDLRAIDAVRRLQQNPELGAFRIHAALKQLGITLSTRTCGRILALNRKLYGLRGPVAKRRDQHQAMPFKADSRHQYWTVDIRYLDHQLGGGHVYCVSILENYSRAMLASALTRSQATPVFLSVLLAAIERYGVPDQLVSDGGGVFRATHAKAIYATLGIEHTRIDPGQAWQSYIETAFNVQRRMADWDFSQARTWTELLDAHEDWLADYNYQDHWAHERRADRRRSPADVLGWVTGQRFSLDQLRRIFAARSERRLDRQGYVRFRNWRIYGERGLAGKAAAIWLYEDHLTLQFEDEALAEYTVAYQRDRHHLRSMAASHLYETRHRSPQLPLLELGSEDWRVAIALREPRRRPRGRSGVVQLPLLPPDEIATAR
jgi:putative transposase